MEPKTQQQIFLDWVKEIETGKNWTDNQWATTAGLSHSVFSKARAGILPRWDACVAMADAAGLPREQAFRAAGLMKPNPKLSPVKETLLHWVTQMDDTDVEDLNVMAEAKVKRKSNQASGTRDKRKP